MQQIKLTNQDAGETVLKQGDKVVVNKFEDGICIFVPAMEYLIGHESIITEHWRDYAIVFGWTWPLTALTLSE